MKIIPPVQLTITVPPEKLLFSLTTDELTMISKSVEKYFCPDKNSILKFITKDIDDSFCIDTNSVIGLTVNHTNNHFVGNSLFLKNYPKFDIKWFLHYWIYKDDMFILIDDFPLVHQWQVSPKLELEQFNIGEYNHFFIANDNENTTSYLNISNLERFVYFYENKEYIYEFDSNNGYILKEVKQIEKKSLNVNLENSIYFVFHEFNQFNIGDIHELNRLLEKQVKNSTGMHSLRLANFCDVIKNIVTNMA